MPEDIYATHIKRNHALITAFAEASAAAARGFGKMTLQCGQFVHRSLETAADANKRIAEAKSPSDFMSIQMSLAKDVFDSVMENGKTMSDLAVSVMKETTEPLTDGFEAAAPAPASKKH